MLYDLQDDYVSEFSSSNTENLDFGLEILFGTMSLEPSSAGDRMPHPRPPRKSQNPVSNPITKQALAEIRNGIR